MVVMVTGVYYDIYNTIAFSGYLAHTRLVLIFKTMKFPKPTKKIKVKKPLRRKGTTPYKKAKDKAWDAFSLFIRTRDAIKTTGSREFCRCYTCANIVPTTGIGSIQAGHFIPSRKNILLFDENQVRGQCFGCNIRNKGRWAEFYTNMVKEYGIEVVTNMIDGKYDIVKFTVPDLEEIQKTYISKLKNL